VLYKITKYGSSLQIFEKMLYEQMPRKTFKKIRYYNSVTLPVPCAQVNPPKPERESNRRRKKKSLAEDFIDITEASSLYMLDYSTSRSGGARAGGTGGRPAPKSGG
jgi:hypothetical protein